MPLFRDRHEAGKELAKTLLIYTQQQDTLILALPRGGVPVAYEVAKTLHLPLDVFIVRKLGVPYNEELAMGAIALGGKIVLDQKLIDHFHISSQQIEQTITKESEELTRRNDLYRKSRPFPDVSGKTIILIDDGVATGSTLKAAILALKTYNPSKIIIAIPVGPSTIFSDFKNLADEIICLKSPEIFYAVGQAYAVFKQITDIDVLDLLTKTTPL